MARYFRCRTNLDGPLLKLDMDWEANEMKTNPDYFECDEDGLVVVADGMAEAQEISFQWPRASKK